MSSIIPIIAHVIVTILALAGLAVKVEHRLTKIETEITWLKQKLDSVCNYAGGCDRKE